MPVSGDSAIENFSGNNRRTFAPGVHTEKSSGINVIIFDRMGQKTRKGEKIVGQGPDRASVCRQGPDRFPPYACLSTHGRSHHPVRKDQGKANPIAASQTGLIILACHGSKVHPFPKGPRSQGVAISLLPLAIPGNRVQRPFFLKAWNLLQNLPHTSLGYPHQALEACSGASPLARYPDFFRI